jgi:hypothetical protein
MEDHAGHAVLGWAASFQFAQGRFQNVVGEIGHRTALPFGLVIERRDQMPSDGG